MWIIGPEGTVDSCAARKDDPLKIRFYGRLSETIGGEVEVDPPEGIGSIVELRTMLADMYPHASPDLRQRSRACIADAFVLEDYQLTGTETVEFLPPLSGG
jgi:molybdopterin converting factor small subunit